jgi:hypothetical protein
LPILPGFPGVRDGHRLAFAYDLEATRYNVSAENNWWGSARGPLPGKVVETVSGYKIDTSSAAKLSLVVARRSFVQTLVLADIATAGSNTRRCWCANIGCRENYAKLLPFPCTLKVKVRCRIR